MAITYDDSATIYDSGIVTYEGASLASPAANAVPWSTTVSIGGMVGSGGMAMVRGADE